MIIEPGVGMEDIRIGASFAVASSSISAQVVVDTPTLKTARIDLGTWNLYIYARGGSEVTGVRLIDSVVFQYGMHGLRELRTLMDMLPRTTEGVGLGSTSAEVIAAFGTPDSRSVEVGGCGIRNRPDEHFRYQGMRLRLCDGIVIDISVE